MPDETMRNIWTVLRKDVKVPEYIYSSIDEATQIYLQKTPIVDKFDGKSTIGQIACQLKKDENSITQDEAYG